MRMSRIILLCTAALAIVGTSYSTYSQDNRVGSNVLPPWQTLTSIGGGTQSRFGNKTSAV